MSGCKVPRCMKRQKLIEWSENDIFKLVSLYKKFPCLWKKDTSAYADNLMRHYAYKKIHEAVNVPGVTFTDVMVKIREVRRAYVNQLKKALIARVSGFVYKTKSPWFILMHEFLYPHLDHDESAKLSVSIFKIAC